jgi:hypothetical protein
MNGTPEPNQQLPADTPKWLIILSCMVSGCIIPAVMAFSPQLSELIHGATEARKAQAENERTALGTVLELVNTSTKQVYVLSQSLESERQEKKILASRISDLEREAKKLEDCQLQLQALKGKYP